MSRYQKLELTWIGKDEELNLEPRILIEDKSKAYGERDTENMLIKGDNLLALKALEADFTGKVKCIYIDPPYNTGNAFEHYDDGLEHSLWLNLMKHRLVILRNLLREDGSIWISIDDKECHYLKVLCDEIFGRKNYITTLTVKMSTASGVKTTHREKTLIKEKEFILCYAKHQDLFKLNPQYIPKIDWDDEFQYILETNNSENIAQWEIKRLNNELRNHNIPYDPQNRDFQDFVIKNAHKIWRRAFIRNEFKEISQKSNSIIYDKKKKHYYYKGRQLYFLNQTFHECFTEDGWKRLPSILVSDFWTDINTGKLFNEGGIDFRNGKKPELLLSRIFHLASNPGDLILDSFLGSGTTAAVAHKMGRRWIGIELGEHCDTHCVPRLQKVIDGTDQGGISKAMSWTGGGGFKYYNLAPSLLQQDEKENWLINPDYDENMLAEAMAKHQGFTYKPNAESFWKHGFSTENDYIYTTHKLISLKLLEEIHSSMRAGETLLICCKAFEAKCKNAFDNITIKKIPASILKKCEFGKEDYSLKITETNSEEEPSLA